MRSARTFRRPHVAADRRGISALEFGLIGGLLATLLLGAWDIGNAAQQQIRLHEALRAAAEYARSFPTDTTGITSAVSGALPGGWTDASVAAPVASCACWNASSGSSASSTCTCPTGETLERFLTLGVSRPFSAMLFRSLTLVSSSYVLRYQ